MAAKPAQGVESVSTLDSPASRDVM